MGEPYVVSALRDKRAEISGMIADLEKELSRQRNQKIGPRRAKNLERLRGIF